MLSRMCNSHGISANRRGTVLPILALTLVTMIGFLALAIDVGMLAIAKTQLQQAADLASLTAARTVNGISTTNYNQTQATANAQNLMSYNLVLGQKLTSSQLSLTYGSYDYNQTTQSFSANYPATTGQPYSAVAATLTSSSLPNAFGKIWGAQLLPNLSATAQAVHRPRDIALSMDLSGSMRFGTCLGFDFYTTSRASNNPDSVYPKFGPYSSSSASMQGPSTNQTSSVQNLTISPSNTTATNSSYSLTYINSFYQNAAYASPLIRAFDSYTSSDGGVTWTAPTSATPQLPPSSYSTVPGGDVPLFKYSSNTAYATTVKDVFNSSSANILWELDGYSTYTSGLLDTSNGGYPAVWSQPDYSALAAQLDGYTQGPGYYGKTFFLWPPDPRNGAITTAAGVKSYLTAMGMNTTDATTLSNNWTTYQGQGMTAGLASLQSWMTSKGYASSGYVTGSNSKALLYYAVCRLFNRAYPAGSANGAFTGDWRVRFFGTNNNTKIFNTSNGQLNTPSSSTYTVNYNAILSWIAQTPCPFPTQMRAGRIKYYGSIPTAITGTWPNYGSTDQRFWVEFIDYALGFRQTSSGNYQDVSGMTGYGSDFTWGTNAVASPPGSGPQYMSYTDNPDRPLTRYWFGPLMMVDYMQNYNMASNVSNYFYMQPGDCYEAPSYTAKQAFVAAINTLQTNAPNDWAAIVPYSWPRTTANTTTGRFNCVRSPLGTNYPYAISSILYPFGTINADGTSNSTEVNPYTADPSTGLVPSADFSDIPRGDGDTCFAMALMLAYNQFAVTPTTDTTLRTYVSSSPIAFPNGMAGGLGRKGTQKVIIFETDGLPNCSATANLMSNGTYKYYKVRYDMNNPSSAEYPSINPTSINDPTVLSQVYSLVQQLATDYGTTRNPFRLYAIGFGPVFQGANASAALSTLENMQYHAGTQSSPSTPLPANQVVYGTDAQMSAAMVSAYTSILQNGVQIALIK